MEGTDNHVAQYLLWCLRKYFARGETDGAVNIETWRREIVRLNCWADAGFSVELNHARQVDLNVDSSFTGTFDQVHMSYGGVRATIVCTKDSFPVHLQAVVNIGH